MHRCDHSRMRQCIGTTAHDDAGERARPHRIQSCLQREKRRKRRSVGAVVEASMGVDEEDLSGRPE
eukprot:402269-Prymnesium_polylepis.1